MLDPRLAPTWSFERPPDGSADVRAPWIERGHPAVWRGTVSVIVDDEVLEEVPGFCVGGACFVPMPASSAKRVVEPWMAGLFELVSLFEYPSESGTSARMNFAAGCIELGIRVRA